MKKHVHKKESWLKTVVFSCIAIALFIGIIESASFLVVKIYNAVKNTNYAPQGVIRYQRWWDFSPVYGPHPKANLPYIFDKTGGALGTDQYGFCHNGDRHRVLLPKKDNAYRIFILGGSTVWGVGVNSNNETIAAQLEAKLRITSPRVEVINAGVRGWMSFQEFTYLSKDLLAYKPDLVIILDGMNDFYYPNFYKDLPPDISPHQQEIMRLINGSLSENPLHVIAWNIKGILVVTADMCKNTLRSTIDYTRYRLYSTFILKKMIHKLHKPAIVNSQEIAPAQNAAIDQRANVNPASYITYIKNLTSIMGVCRAHSIDCMILFQPTLASGDKKEITASEKDILNNIETSYSMKNIVALIQSYCAIMKVEFENLQKKQSNPHVWIENLSELFSQTKECVYFDAVHYNSRGAEMIATEIAEKIKKNFLP